MRRLIVGRLLEAIVVTLLVTTLVFVLVRLAPGDPMRQGLERAHLDPAIVQQLRAQQGLDRPIAEQYLAYLRNLAHGDLGYSYTRGVPVRDLISAALPRTLLLMGTGLTLGLLFGVLLGVMQGQRPGSPTDRVLGRITLLFYSMPDFWLGIVMLLLFAYWFPVLPAGGIAAPVVHDLMSATRQLFDTLRHLLLPAATLAAIIAAVVARYQRTAVIETLDEPFVRTARAKGLAERSVVARHVLRNSLFPVITLAGLLFPALLGGAVVVERVFSWPGMGSLSLEALAARDYPLVVATALVGSVTTVIGGLVADVLYRAADPRLRRS